MAPNVTAGLLQTSANAERPSTPAQPIDPLTVREEEVLTEVARGKTNAEIAEARGLKSDTAYRLSVVVIRTQRSQPGLGKWGGADGI